MTIESAGAYSSHSAGVRRGGSFPISIPSVTPNDSAVLAEFFGAEKYATLVDTSMRIATIVRLCQGEIVWLSGITPLILSNPAGMEDGVAISSAADEESPNAQTVPLPR